MQIYLSQIQSSLTFFVAQLTLNNENKGNKGIKKNSRIKVNKGIKKKSCNKVNKGIKKNSRIKVN